MKTPDVDVEVCVSDVSAEDVKGKQARNVPPFLTKLFTILSIESFHAFIHWSENGKKVIVVDKAKFQANGKSCSVLRDQDGTLV